MTYRDPRLYKPDEINRMMNKPITIDIGHPSNSKVIESIDCVIISGTMTEGPTVETLTIKTTTGEIRTFHIRMIKQFRPRE